jgi:DNA topoisomerase 2-associated protein PAT1
MEAPEHSGLLEDGGVDGGDYGGFGGPDDGGYQFSSMGDEVWFSAPSCLAQPASVFA